MTPLLTPRQDRLRVLRARRDQLDALIKRLGEAERQDGDIPARPVAKCGTDSGYDRHRKRGEDPCEPCRAARREASRLRYLRRKEQRAARLGVAS